MYCQQERKRKKKQHKAALMHFHTDHDKTVQMYNVMTLLNQNNSSLQSYSRQVWSNMAQQHMLFLVFSLVCWFFFSQSVSEEMGYPVKFDFRSQAWSFCSCTKVTTQHGARKVLSMLGLYTQNKSVPRKEYMSSVCLNIMMQLQLLEIFSNKKRDSVAKKMGHNSRFNIL